MNTITHDIFVTVAPPKNFAKQLRGLNRNTKFTKLLAIVTAVLALTSDAERRRLEEQVYQLSVRVKKLERGEGE